MKTLLGTAGLVACVLAAPAAHADELMNAREFDTASKASMEDSRIVLGLANAAQVLSYCGEKSKSDDIHEFMKGLLPAMTYQAFAKDASSETSKLNMRGMYLSRQAAIGYASELTTMAMIKQLEPLSADQKKALCDDAGKTYVKFSEMKAREAAMTSATTPAAKPAAK